MHDRRLFANLIDGSGRHRLHLYEFLPETLYIGIGKKTPMRNSEAFMQHYADYSFNDVDEKASY